MIEDGFGSKRQINIDRSELCQTVAEQPERIRPGVYAVLSSGHGYIDMARLKMSDVNSALAAVANTPALIFDMRGYPHGTGFAIAPRLGKGRLPAVSARFRRPAATAARAPAAAAAVPGFADKDGRPEVGDGGGEISRAHKHAEDWNDLDPQT